MKNKIKNKQYYKKKSDIDGYQWRIIDGAHYLFQLNKYTNIRAFISNEDIDLLYPHEKLWLIKIALDIKDTNYKIYFNFNYIIYKFPTYMEYTDKLELEMMIFENSKKVSITKIKNDAVEQMIYNFGIIFHTLDIIPSRLDKIDDLLDSN
jgi:hypothetical protein